MRHGSILIEKFKRVDSLFFVIIHSFFDIKIPMKFIFWSIFLLFTISFAFDVTQFSSSQILTVTGSTNGSSFQFPISNAGDINKDGRDDILIGGYGLEDGGLYESVYLIYGQSNFSSVNLDFQTFEVNQSSAGISIVGNIGSDGFGSAVSGAGDIDGDGNDDFMIGAFRKGIVYVIYGGSDLQNMDVSLPDLDPATTGFTISGDNSEDYVGFSISKAGRINDDLLDDIIVGLHGKNNQTGAAVVVFGESRAMRSNISINGSFALIDPQTTGFTLLGEAPGDLFGYSVSSAGDVNNDGRDDIIIGAPRKGAAYVIYGSQSPADIDLSIETLDPATTGFIVLGETAGDYFGISVSAAGDVNGDGIADIIVGANNTGAAYIIYGSETPSNIDLSNQTLTAASTGFVVKGGNQLGSSVTSLGDLNDDGYGDVMIGAPGGQGAVHVIYGGKPDDMIDLTMTPLDPAMNGFTFTRSGVADGGFGSSISSGRFNDDNKIELFVGTTTKTSSSPMVGYVIDISRKQGGKIVD